MSSRAERKREARAQREAAERAEAEARRKRTFAIAGGAALLAIVVIVIAIVVSQGGSDSDSSAAADNSLFQGIPQNGIALGDPDAPVTMVEFADLQCPFCAEYSKEVLPDLVEKYVRPGDVRMELRLISILGPDSANGALVAGAAAQQDGIWPFAEHVYANQEAEGSGYMTTDFLRQQAEAAGLDAEQAIEDSRKPKAQKYADESLDEAQSAAISSTPSFLIGPTGGKLELLRFGGLETSEFEPAIDEAIQNASK